jgi:hypothetical protein
LHDMSAMCGNGSTTGTPRTVTRRLHAPNRPDPAVARKRSAAVVPITARHTWCDRPTARRTPPTPAIQSSVSAWLPFPEPPGSPVAASGSSSSQS